MKIFKHWRKLLLFFLVFVLTIPFLTRARGGDAYSQLPLSGSNFSNYSTSLHFLGRCYLLAPVTQIIVDAYALLQVTCPKQKFIYAEMGWKGGGRFDPHRTHKQGKSADFLTPMLNKTTKQPELLPISPINRWGYDLRLNNSGEYLHLKLDAGAVIQHLAALDSSAKTHGWRIKQVIFDLPMQKILQAHPAYKQIAHIPFMAGQAWFPHDGHYHVDFEQR